MKIDLRDRDKERPRKPFTLTVYPTPEPGEDEEPVEVEFIDPKRLHWTKLAELEQATGVGPVAAVLVPDAKQYDALKRDPDLDAAAMEWALIQWRRHFGLGEQGN